jgi:hypothetical protein
VNAVLATRGAHGEGVELHIYALGGQAGAFPKFVRSLLHGSAGSFTRVREPGEAASFLREVSFTAIDRVMIENLTTGKPSPEIVLTPDGHFSGRVAVVSGRNQVLVTAVARDGREHRREFAFDYANPNDRKRLLDAERTRIQKHQRRGKEIEIEPVTPAGSSRGTPAP